MRRFWGTTSDKDVQRLNSMLETHVAPIYSQSTHILLLKCRYTWTDNGTKYSPTDSTNPLLTRMPLRGSHASCMQARSALNSGSAQDFKRGMMEGRIRLAGSSFI